MGQYTKTGPGAEDWEMKRAPRRGKLVFSPGRVLVSTSIMVGLDVAGACIESYQGHPWISAMLGASGFMVMLMGLMTAAAVDKYLLDEIAHVLTKEEDETDAG